MKRALLTLVAVLYIGIFSHVNAQSGSGDPVYIEVISNNSKSINFILGVYPKTYSWSEALQASQLTMRILNNASDDYFWNDYKVYILLKDNTLFYNYKTKAETGEYACTYTIKGNGGFNDQTMSFDKKFDIKDIKSMWVSFSDNTFIELLYSE